MSAALQLTYTSYDDLRGGRGGWQVKAASPGLAEQELKHALTLVATELDLVEPPSAFPSHDQVAALPRRMLVTVDKRGTAYIVHTTYAGADASGRHGNVFNHVLVLPDLLSSRLDQQPRPLQWWRSSDWHTPYGPDAVSQDPAPAGLVSTGPVVSREAVGCFLAQGRGPTVGLLLDAVELALTGGPKVVLALDDQDEAVLWMAAISFLAPAPVQRDLSFSTYERVHSLQASADSALVCVVPEQDALQAALLPDHRLIDVRAAPSSACRGTWARLGGAVAGTGAGAADRLLALDELAAFNPAATGMQSLWPLAVAVMESAEAEATWPDALRVLLQVPLMAVDDQETRNSVSSFIDTAIGSSPASARAFLDEQLRTPGSARDHLVRAYLRYLSMLAEDATEITTSWPPLVCQLDPVEDARALDGIATGIAEAIGARRNEVLGDDAVVLLRLLDLVQQTGTAPLLEDDDRVSAGAAAAATWLMRADAADLVVRCGPVTPSTALLLAGALGEHLRTAGLPALDPAVATWLRDGVGCNLDGLPMTVTQELALAYTGTSHDPLNRASALSALLQSEQWKPGAAPLDRVRSAVEVLGGSPWTADEVAAALRATAGQREADLSGLVRELLRAAPLGSPGTVEVAELALQDDRLDREPDVRHLAWVHQRAVPQWWETGRDPWIRPPSPS